jgi:hypothetical protein
MRLLELMPGDSIYFEVVSEDPVEVRLVAADTVTDRYRAGLTVRSSGSIARTDVPNERNPTGRRRKGSTPPVGSVESREERADVE